MRKSQHENGKCFWLPKKAPYSTTQNAKCHLTNITNNGETPDDFDDTPNPGLKKLPWSFSIKR